MTAPEATLSPPPLPPEAQPAAAPSPFAGDAPPFGEGEGVLRPTGLTRGLLNALDRPPHDFLVPGTLGTVVAGLLTAGVWPAIALSRKWLQTLRWHRYVMWNLAEWAGVNVGHDAGMRLHAANETDAPRCLARAAMVVAIVAAAQLALAFINGRPLVEYWHAGSSRMSGVGVFFALLLGSYLLTWLSINLQVRRLRGLVEAMEQATPQVGQGAGKPLATWEPGVRVVPLLVGGIFAIAGLVWVLPMLLVSTAQQRAVLEHHREARSRLAVRARAVLARQRPAIAMPAVVNRVHICRNSTCDQRLPPHARFCPRCGLPQRPIAEVLV